MNGHNHDISKVWTFHILPCAPSQKIGWDALVSDGEKTKTFEQQCLFGIQKHSPRWYLSPTAKFCLARFVYVSCPQLSPSHLNRISKYTLGRGFNCSYIFVVDFSTGQTAWSMANMNAGWVNRQLGWTSQWVAILVAAVVVVEARVGVGQAGVVARVEVVRVIWVVLLCQTATVVNLNSAFASPLSLSSPFKQSSEETTQPQRCALRLDMVMCSVPAVSITHAGEFKTPW